MFDIITRMVKFDSVENLLRKLAGCSVKVIDDHTAEVTGYQSIMDIFYDDFEWGVVVR